MNMRKELIQACEKNTLCDFITNNAYQIEKEQLVTILKACLFIMDDNGIHDSIVLNELRNELGN